MTAGAWIATVASTALVAMSPEHAAAGAKSMDDVVAINFSRGVGWSGHELLELVKGSVSTVELTFNYDGRSEIGVWQTVLPVQRFNAALAAVSASGYETVPGPSVDPPETKLLSLGVRRSTDEVPRIRTFPMKPPPPEIVPAVTALDAVIAEIRKHPVRVLRGQANVVAPKVRRGEELAVDLILANAGVEPLHLANPVAAVAGDLTGIRLVLSDTGRDDHAVGLRPTDVTCPGLASGPITVLPPGASLRLRARTKVDWPAGKGRLRVELDQASGDSSDPALVEGTLWLDAGPITVERSSRWKFWE
jgi:hypothetical protein